MASVFKNLRLRIPRSLLSAQYSTQTQPFPSFKAAKSAIISESDPEKLAEIFEQCAQFPTFRRHRPIYNLSIRKLHRAKRPDLVDRVLQTQKNYLENSPMLKSEGFWIRLMMLYSNAGMVDQALQVLEHYCEKKYCNVSEKSLCAVLSIYLNNKLFDKIHECFETMPKKLGVEPGVASHNLVLKVFLSEGEIQKAGDWIVKMEKEWKVMPNIDTYNLLLGTYLENKDFAKFDAVVKRIVKKGLEQNSKSYSHRISRICEGKEIDVAEKLLDEMVSKGLKPNSACYNSIINGYCKMEDPESGRKFLEKMKADGYVLPCSFTYFTLLDAMVSAEKFDSALEICEEIMKRKWVPPFNPTLKMLNGLVEMSKAEEAKQFVEKMKKMLTAEALSSWEKRVNSEVNLTGKTNETDDEWY